jgi:hypothetical protein
MFARFAPPHHRRLHTLQAKLLIPIVGLMIASLVLSRRLVTLILPKIRPITST